MPPTSSPAKGLSADQIALLTEVVARSNLNLTMDQWNSLATDLNISNGKAAKERFRYMMKNLTTACNQTSPLTPTVAKSTRRANGTDTKPNNGKAQASTTKKRSAPSRAGGLSAKKVKVEAPIKQEQHIVLDMHVPTEAEDDIDELALSGDEEKNMAATANANDDLGMKVEVTGALGGLEYSELRNAIQEDDLDGLFDRMEQGIQQADDSVLYKQED